MFLQIRVPNVMKIDHLVLKLWSKNQFQMKNLGFRSDNHGKNCWHTSSDLGEKMTPLPQSNVDPSHVVRSQCQIPQHWLMGAGKEYDKGEDLCFLLNNVMPHFLF